MGSQAISHQVVWFDIPCRDLDRAIGFYSAVLGCEIAMQGGPEFPLGILPHQSETVGGCLYRDDAHAGSGGGVLIYLNCQGRLDEAISAVREQGGTVVEDKHAIGPHGYRAVILDTEGNRLALHSM